MGSMRFVLCFGGRLGFLAYVVMLDLDDTACACEELHFCKEGEECLQ